MQNYTRTIIICVLGSLLSACSNAKYLIDGEYFYKNTEIVFEDNTEMAMDSNQLSNRLADLSKTKPNKKVLGIYPLKLWFYNIGDRGIDMYVTNRTELNKRFLFFDFEKLVSEINILEPKSKFRNWLMYKLGEPPSLIDTSQIEETEIRMENYLYNRGYFYPDVNYSVIYNEMNKRAIVSYEIQANKLYRMDEIIYAIDDPKIGQMIQQIPEKSLLQMGNPIDVDFIKYERTRIANYLLDNGYYTFEKDLIYFEVDTANFDSLDIYVKISKPQGDSILYRYRLNQIYVYPEANKDFNSNKTLDTILYSDDKSDYYIISSKNHYKPKSLSDHIFIDDSSTVLINDTIKYKPSYYQISDVRETRASLNNLGIFEPVQIEFIETDTGENFRYLDVYIKLKPLPLKQTTYEFNASTTSDYLLGTSLNLSLAQKNVLHRLDQLRLSIAAGIESNVSGENIGINTTEVSSTLDLTLPRFFWPLKINIPKRYFPVTKSAIEFAYLDRNNFYRLYNTSFKWGAQWYENSQAKEYKVDLINMNNVQVPKTSAEFDSILSENLLLKQSFEPQFIFGPTASFIYNSQLKNDKRNDIYFRISAEVAGTIYFLVNAAVENRNPFAKNTDSIYYEIANQTYSNFTKIDVDFRNYFDLNNTSQIASRITFGIAVPYWNSDVIPYVKQFYAGGTNDIRAFSIRQLGPGAYFPYTEIIDSIVTAKPGDQSGDIKLQLNIEYRFDIISILEGALFCDIGNIWTINKDPFRPLTNFEFKNFGKELAIGPGAGIRLDFSYVVLRLDAAYPLYDPGLDGQSANLLDELEKAGYVVPQKSIQWNFAISYPF